MVETFVWFGCYWKNKARNPKVDLYGDQDPDDDTEPLTPTALAGAEASGPATPKIRELPPELSHRFYSLFFVFRLFAANLSVR